MTTEAMHDAAELLRKAARDPAQTSAFVIAVACFQAMCGQLKADGNRRSTEDFAEAARQAATLLDPVCPHCHKPISAPTSGDDRG